MTPEAFVTATSDPFQKVGAVHYFHDIAREEATAIDLDLFRFYFCGRGGVLGPTHSSVVLSAFGYFNPELLDKMWTTGAQRCDVEVAARAQMNAAYRIGETGLADVDGLGDAADALSELTSSVDVAGLTLFAGFQMLDSPTSPAARFMHQAILMRELRGSVHLAALAAAGCPSRVAHQLRRPDDQEMFGWTDPLEIDPAMRDAYESVEPLTDAAMACHVAAISDDQREMVAGVATAAAAALAG